MLAGTEFGLFRSTNGGNSWSAVAGPPADQITAIAFDPTAPANVYAVSISGYVGRSTNAGETWQALGGDPAAQRPQAVTVDPTNGATVYVGTLDNGVYKVGLDATGQRLDLFPASSASITPSLP